MKIRTSATATILVCALIVAVPAAAQAQSGGNKYETSPPTLEQPSDQVQITPEKIAAFVDAAIAVTKVRNTWKSKVDAAKTEAEAEQLRNEASADMRKTVENSPGITASEYIAIARAAQQNPDLNNAIKERFDARRQELQQKSQ